MYGIILLAVIFIPIALCVALAMIGAPWWVVLIAGVIAGWWVRETLS